MTEEILREREEYLSKERERIIQQVNALGADLHRVEGALADCAYWRERLMDKPQAAPES